MKQRTPGPYREKVTITFPSALVATDMIFIQALLPSDKITLLQTIALILLVVTLPLIVTYIIFRLYESALKAYPDTKEIYYLADYALIACICNLIGLDLILLNLSLIIGITFIISIIISLIIFFKILTQFEGLEKEITKTHNS